MDVRNRAAGRYEDEYSDDKESLLSDAAADEHAKAVKAESKAMRTLRLTAVSGLFMVIG
jgi:hypothetical protein